jgi:large subunit ribosomal protein L10
MALNIEDKKAVVAEVADVAQSALSVVAADYRGLTVGQMTDLRSRARNSGVYLKVVRNTLARLAVKGTEFECLADALTGPLVLAFSKEEPGAAARLIRDFSKECDSLEVKSLAIAGQLHGPEQLAAVAKLPTREEALASLCAVMKAPVEKFVRTLAEPHSQMVRVFGAVRDQKQQSA